MSDAEPRLAPVPPSRLVTSLHPTVLVPGAGGDAAIGAIRSLRRAGYPGRIVTSDADPMSPGFYLADAHGVLPPIKDAEFFPRACALIEREGVELVLPTSGFDTIVYAERREELEARGVSSAVSPHEAVQVCIDKWRFVRAVGGRFPIPWSTLDPREVASWPCFVKPVRGKGSRGIALCRTREELDAQVASQRDLLIQEFLPGEEYSVDTLSDLSGKALVAIPRTRLATKVGISVRGRIVRDPELERLSLELADHLGLRGPSCIQWRRAADGRPKLLEINPRMGGGTIFCTLAGVNIPLLTIALARGEKPQIPSPREITILRHYDEVVVEDHL